MQNSFIYHFNHTGFTPHAYRIVKFSGDELWYFYSQDTLIGGISKYNDQWRQTSGREALQELVDGIGSAIDSL